MHSLGHRLGRGLTRAAELKPGAEPITKRSGPKEITFGLALLSQAFTVAHFPAKNADNDRSCRAGVLHDFWVSIGSDCAGPHVFQNLSFGTYNDNDDTKPLQKRKEEKRAYPAKENFPCSFAWFGTQQGLLWGTCKYYDSVLLFVFSSSS